MQGELQNKNSRFSSKQVLKSLQNNIIVIGILLMAIVVGILKPNFFSEANLRNLISNTAVRFIIALGVSGCLITKGTDLSAGRVAGLAACLSAIFLQKNDYSGKIYQNLQIDPSFQGWYILLVLAGVLAVCGLIGSLNGIIISYLKVPPFLATLGMQILVYGVCLVYTGASPIGGLDSSYTNLAKDAVPANIGLVVIAILTIAMTVWIFIHRERYGTKFLFNLIMTVLVGAVAFLMGIFLSSAIFGYVAITAVVVGILIWFLYNKTRHGKYMYAVGGNETAAEVAGVNTSKTKIKIYILAGMLYGLCGFLIAARAGGASVNTAQGYELEAIAGCTIGGVSVNGGVGKVNGILIGVLVFEILKIAMQFLGIQSDYTYIVQGLVIIIAVALDLRKYLAKK